MKTVSQTAPEAKRKRLRPRRPNSAKDGDTFLTILDVCNRWGVVRRTAKARIREAKIPPYNLSAQCVRYALADIIAFEQNAKGTK